ncbi:MAG: hypothetical protein ACK5VI_03465 [Opitutia bacterium]
MAPGPAPAPHAALAERLRVAQPWLRLVGILCWVAAGLLLAGMLLLLLADSMGLASRNPEYDGASAGFLFLVHGALAILHVYPAVLLLRAATLIRHPFDDATSVAKALEALRRLWKYLGICIVVGLSLALLLVGAIVLIAISQAAGS